jgi:protein phosphatase
MGRPLAVRRDPPPGRSQPTDRRGRVAPIVLPGRSLVLLIGAAGSGKSTFAARQFAADDVLSSDAIRGRLSGDEADQSRTRTAFAILHREAGKRLAAGRLVVVDATNVERAARLALLRLGAAAGVPVIAIVLAVPAALVLERNAGRDRVVDPAIVDRHLAKLGALLESGGLAAEGFAAVHMLRSAQDVEAVRVERTR